MRAYSARDQILDGIWARLGLNRRSEDEEIRDAIFEKIFGKMCDGLLGQKFEVDADFTAGHAALNLSACQLFSMTVNRATLVVGVVGVGLGSRIRMIFSMMMIGVMSICNVVRDEVMLTQMNHSFAEACHLEGQS